ncbi:MAG: DUF5058 family protein [Clostridiales bacterium]|nr:DUF5058 family protein [Clostridiales bacterium]
MAFDVNSPLLFILSGVVVVAVLAQSLFFLVKAWKRGREIGMDKDKLKKTAVTAAIFTIAPAVAIVIGVITLSKDLGVPLPWLRLSVVGSLSYETIAATNAENAMGLTFGSVASLTASQYVTIATVMTVSIMVGIWLVPLVSKKVLGGMINLEKRDKKWSEIFSAAMFIGMIAAFLGFIFSDVSDVFIGSTAGLIPVCVMVVSALVMCLAGLAVKRFKNHWISDYALPASLVLGMASAIPITGWLG